MNNMKDIKHKIVWQNTLTLPGTDESVKVRAVLIGEVSTRKIGVVYEKYINDEDFTGVRTSYWTRIENEAIVQRFHVACMLNKDYGNGEDITPETLYEAFFGDKS